jgi:biopolymer transport protein ExbB
MTRLFSLFLTGGWVMWPILFCSIVALAIIIERIVYYIASRDYLARLEEAVKEDKAEAVGKLILKEGERGLAILGVIASVATLMGLFGTVLGMIQVFQKLASIGGRADVALLSNGIWVALLTTAFGLIVAIPSQAAYQIFNHIVELRANDMDNFMEEVGENTKEGSL